LTSLGRVQLIANDEQCVRRSIRVVAGVGCLLDIGGNLHQSRTQPVLLSFAHSHGQPRQVSIDSVKEIFFVSLGVLRRLHDRVRELVKGEAVTWFDRPSARSLGQLMPQAFVDGELDIAHAQRRTELSGIQFGRVIFRRTG
jgi:hypothetical protein